jgi:hypothetical protein
VVDERQRSICWFLRSGFKALDGVLKPLLFLFLDLIGLNDDKILSTHLKNVFWPNIFVGASFKILNIQQHASGLRPTKIVRSGGKSSIAGKLGPAARVPAKPLGEDGILNQNPIFETGSN